MVETMQGKKHQAPTSNIQRNSNLQTSSRALTLFGAWTLGASLALVPRHVRPKAPAAAGWPVKFSSARPGLEKSRVDLCGRMRHLAASATIEEIIMSQAIMDPEKVRRFAEELQRFNSEIENRMVLLHARFAALGDTWSDQEHEKFSEEFKQALKALKKFTELSKEHTPYLLRKAQRIEEYLNQR